MHLHAAAEGDGIFRFHIQIGGGNAMADCAQENLGSAIDVVRVIIRRAGSGHVHIIIAAQPCVMDDYGAFHLHNQLRFCIDICAQRLCGCFCKAIDCQLSDLCVDFHIARGDFRTGNAAAIDFYDGLQNDIIVGMCVGTRAQAGSIRIGICV